MGIGNRHSVNLFSAGKSQPLVDQRLAKVGYKVTKDKKTKKAIPQKFPSICVSVPFLTEAEIMVHSTELFPYVQNFLHDTQDKVIRSLYENSNGKMLSVSSEEIDVMACIAFLAAESEGGKLNKEFIEEWFSVNLSDNLSVALAEKSGIEVDDARIEQAVNGFKGLFSGLNSGKTFYAPEQVDQLQKALELCSESDETYKRLVLRLQKMAEKPEVKLALNL